MASSAMLLLHRVLADGAFSCLKSMRWNCYHLECITLKEMFKCFPYVHWLSRAICCAITGNVPRDTYGMKSRVLILIQSVYYYLQEIAVTGNTKFGPSRSNRNQTERWRRAVSGVGQASSITLRKAHFILLAAFQAFASAFVKSDMCGTLTWNRAKPEQLPLNPGMGKGSFWLVQGPFHTSFSIQRTHTALQKNQGRSKPITVHVYHGYLYVSMWAEQVLLPLIYFLLYLWVVQEILRNFIKGTGMAFLYL